MINEGDYYLKNVEILITPSKYIRIRGIRVSKRHLGGGIAIILAIFILFAISLIIKDEIQIMDTSATIIIISIIGLILDYYALIKKSGPSIYTEFDVRQAMGDGIQDFAPLRIIGNDNTITLEKNYYSKTQEGDEANVKD